MKRLILLPVLCLLFLASCSEPPPPAPLPLPIPILYDNALHDGSVVFWEGGLLSNVIVKHTGSTISHAAVILYNGNVPYVYEAVPPCVHKVSLTEYKVEMAEKAHAKRPVTYFIMEPKNRYTLAQLKAMKTFAESQLGRKYMLRGWWKGHEARGVFCSEFAGDVLNASGRIKAGGIRESPGSLYKKIAPTHEKK